MSETVTGLALTRLDYSSLDLPLVSATTLVPGEPVDPPEWDSYSIGGGAPVTLPGSIQVYVEAVAEGEPITRTQRFARSLLPIRHGHASSSWWDAPTDLLALNSRRVVRVEFTWPDDAKVWHLAEPTGWTWVHILNGDVTEELTTADLVTLADYP